MHVPTQVILHNRLVAALMHTAAGLCRVHQGKDASHLICMFPYK